MLNWPADGVMFDVERNGFWYAAWGTNPADTDAANVVAREMLAQAPAMFPIYGHRFLPVGRGTFGHPVLSIWQTSIICYGADIADYIHSEFGGDTSPDSTPQATVGFWRDLV